ncbi:uncharacterized protein [Bemisia tabaci]|uniref:uncharacterized protein isoform X2 n=1 Tax=Bemisia tabaci TaxID=7038 RepID=UPI003B282685
MSGEASKIRQALVDKNSVAIKHSKKKKLEVTYSLSDSGDIFEEKKSSQCKRRPIIRPQENCNVRTNHIITHKSSTNKNDAFPSRLPTLCRSKSVAEIKLKAASNKSKMDLSPATAYAARRTPLPFRSFPKIPRTPVNAPSIPGAPKFDHKVNCKIPILQRSKSCVSMRRSVFTSTPLKDSSGSLILGLSPIVPQNAPQPPVIIPSQELKRTTERIARVDSNLPLKSSVKKYPSLLPDESVIPDVPAADIKHTTFVKTTGNFVSKQTVQSTSKEQAATSTVTLKTVKPSRARITKSKTSSFNPLQSSDENNRNETVIFVGDKNIIANENILKPASVVPQQKSIAKKIDETINLSLDMQLRNGTTNKGLPLISNNENVAASSSQGESSKVKVTMETKRGKKKDKSQTGKTNEPPKEALSEIISQSVRQEPEGNQTGGVSKPRRRQKKDETIQGPVQSMKNPENVKIRSSRRKNGKNTVQVDCAIDMDIVEKEAEHKLEALSPSTAENVSNAHEAGASSETADSKLLANVTTRRRKTAEPANEVPAKRPRSELVGQAEKDTKKSKERKSSRVAGKLVARRTRRKVENQPMEESSKENDVLKDAETKDVNGMCVIALSERGQNMETTSNSEKPRTRAARSKRGELAPSNDQTEVNDDLTRNTRSRVAFEAEVSEQRYAKSKKGNLARNRTPDEDCLPSSTSVLDRPKAKTRPSRCDADSAEVGNSNRSRRAATNLILTNDMKLSEVKTFWNQKVSYHIHNTRSEDPSHKYASLALFQHEDSKIQCGVLEIPPQNYKPEQKHRRDLMLTVLDGTCDVIVNGKHQKLDFGSVMVLPKGSLYGIKNIGLKTCKILFTMMPALVPNLSSA